jgi:hypothetical protein
MKLKVPFVRSLKKWKGQGWCGPYALASMLRYYKDKSSLPEIVKNVGTQPKGGTPPKGIAYYCLSRGLNVDYVCEYDTYNFSKGGYSKRYSQFMKNFGEPKFDIKFDGKCKKFSGYKYIKQKASLKLIEKYLDSGMPVVLYLNIAVIMGLDKLSSHYVCVVGYDSKNVYIHNVFPKNQRFQKVSKKLFWQAYTSDGMKGPLIVGYLEKS